MWRLWFPPTVRRSFNITFIQRIITPRLYARSWVWGACRVSTIQQPSYVPIIHIYFQERLPVHEFRVEWEVHCPCPQSARRHCPPSQCCPMVVPSGSAADRCQPHNTGDAATSTILTPNSIQRSIYCVFERYGTIAHHNFNYCFKIYLPIHKQSRKIKSPRYIGGDFMFLYRFVRRRRRRPQILVHGITFEPPFGFLSFLERLFALTYRLPD